MKRIFTSIVLAAFCVFNASAQLEDGFYRVKNNKTKRYISIADNNPKHYTVSQSGSTALLGIRTLKNFDRVSCSPSTIIYVKNMDRSKSLYDLQGQGTGIYALSGNTILAKLEGGGTSYKASGTYSGVTISIADLADDGQRDEAWLANNSEETARWNFIKVDTDTNYIGIKPDVKADDGYYGTIYAGFAFKFVSSGMKAYYVKSASGKSFEMKEITGTIPANTPVIIKCASDNPAENMIMPVLEDIAKPSGNKLAGIYSAVKYKNSNMTAFTASTMRVLGVSDGKLAFVKKAPEDYFYESKYLPANKAYLKVKSSDGDVMTIGGSGIVTVTADPVDASKEGIYTLTGTRLPDNAPLRPGIYIKDGKKIVIK